jgi:hypothetical protein
VPVPSSAKVIEEIEATNKAFVLIEFEVVAADVPTALVAVTENV